jgi:hypothetical protein
MIKETENPRNFLTPQMNSYDNLTNNWRAFLMYFHTSKFSSINVNTDLYGFRYGIKDGVQYSPEKMNNEGEVSLLIGGSTVFGVGASTDENTITSILSKPKSQNIKGETWLNFGGRAFGSNQELILFNQFSYKLPKIKNVIIFSGLNDLYLSLFRDKGEHFGSFYFQKKFESAMNDSVLTWKGRIFKFLFHKILKDRVDYTSLRLNTIVKTVKNALITNVAVEEIKFDSDYAADQIKKNLFTWKHLSKSLDFNLIYILQPVPHWFNKKLSKEEILLFSDLDKSRDNNKLLPLLDFTLYDELKNRLQIICKDLSVPFYDSNSHFKKDNLNVWMFVDRAHLTDLGNAEVANMINKILGGVITE